VSKLGLSCIILLALSSVEVCGKAWHGLEPFHSTRKDVIKLFSSCADTTTPCEFSLNQQEISVRFSNSMSQEYGDCAKHLPIDTVMVITVKPLQKLPLRKLGINASGFQRFDSSIPADSDYQGLVSRKDGLIVTMFKNNVTQAIYLPTLEESRGCEDFYDKSQAMARVTILYHSPMIQLSCPESARAGEQVELKAFIDSTDYESEPQYVWKVSEAASFVGQGSERIKIDTSGLQGKKISVAVRVGGSNAGCVIPIEK